MKSEPASDVKCRDKFLVQAVPITSDKEFANVASIVSGIAPRHGLAPMVDAF